MSFVTFSRKVKVFAFPIQTDNEGKFGKTTATSDGLRTEGASQQNGISIKAEYFFRYSPRQMQLNFSPQIASFTSGQNHMTRSVTTLETAYKVKSLIK